MCSLPTAELRARRGEIQALLEGAIAIVDLADGVELRFAATSEKAHALTDLILLERVCCSSLTYELRSTPDHSYMALRVTGPPAHHAALRAMFAVAPG